MNKMADEQVKKKIRMPENLSLDRWYSRSDDYPCHSRYHYLC